MQTTLNNRIANADGVFWEPFPWGEEEMTWLNQRFRAADTWALGRDLRPSCPGGPGGRGRGRNPDAGRITAGWTGSSPRCSSMTKLVVSRTLELGHRHRVVNGAATSPPSSAVERRDGNDILGPVGPATLAPLSRHATA